ncbi:hypothetical protein [Lentzea sp. NBRC 102530]|uniref:hypothetical protein n=1 Tax=Lentzea sp. NBRC 102530 TaxID=3032201 RepID=UPI0024A3DABF|nr:hypothetical protein [Lentzea sp. NBRC 102530]GLY55217.1 hypothetical protein Lesp01_88720 [Lentzea sp. NBRC 102530]
MPTSRVARTSRAQLDHTFFDLDGETPASPTGTVTVAVTDANNTAVTSGNATAAGDGRYTFVLPGQSVLGELTARWTATLDGTTVVEDDLVEVCGAHLFTLQQGRAADASLANTTQYPTAALREARLQTEAEVEEICDRAFTPRYRRLVLDGTGTDELILDDNEIRRVRAVRVAPRADGTYTPLTTEQLAALVVTPDRVLRRVDGGTWTAGRGNVIVEYEHGLNAPAADLVRAMLVRFRSFANVGKTNTPDRAKSFTTTDGTTYRVTLPDAYRTGLPFVDGIYSRYSLRSLSAESTGSSGGGGGGGGASSPASRTLDFNPQHDSIFHGGRR